MANLRPLNLQLTARPIGHLATNWTSSCGRFWSRFARTFELCVPLFVLFRPAAVQWAQQQTRLVPRVRVSIGNDLQTGGWPQMQNTGATSREATKQRPLRGGHAREPNGRLACAI